MPNFTVRVELHGGTADDYETLHAEMETEGFSRTIRSGDGVDYHLPTAEYEIRGSLSRDGVLEKAKTAATRTRKDFGVLVTESAGRAWKGLLKVRG